MKQFLSILVVSAAMLVALVLAQDQSRVTREGPYWVRTISGAIGRPPFKGLRLETVGSVILRGDTGDRSVYTFKAHVRARDEKEAEALLRQFEIKTGTEGERAYLTIRSGRPVSEGSELSVSVPRALRQVWIATDGGSVQVSDLDGEMEVRSAGGPIAVDGVRGSADIRTGGGDIQVGSVSGPLRCFSGGGAIRVQNAGGECWLETAGGEIFVHQAMAPVHATARGNIRIDRVAGPVYATTAGGLIDVQQADGAVIAESSGGAIQINAANGVECDSAGGAIRLRNVVGAMHASTNAGSILAELLTGHRIQDSVLSTHAGDITVLIPSNFAVTVVAMNGSPGAAGRIVSDFPEIRARTAGQPGGVPVVAEGALNGGGPVLHINVIGGTIYLRRQK